MRVRFFDVGLRRFLSRVGGGLVVLGLASGCASLGRSPPNPEDQIAVQVGSMLSQTVNTYDRRRYAFYLDQDQEEPQVAVCVRYRATGSRIPLDSCFSAGGPYFEIDMDARLRTRFWEDVANHALRQYLTAGGTLDDDSGEPFVLDLTPTLAAIERDIRTPFERGEPDEPVFQYEYLSRIRTIGPRGTY